MEVLGMGHETSPRQAKFSFGRRSPAFLAPLEDSPQEPHLRKVTEHEMIPVEHSSPESYVEAIRKIVEGSSSPTRTLLGVSYRDLGGNASQREYTFSLDAQFFHHDQEGGNLHYFQHQTCPNTGRRVQGVNDERLDIQKETEGFLEEVIEELRARDLFTEEGAVFSLSAESEQVRNGVPFHYLVYFIKPKQ